MFSQALEIVLTVAYREATSRRHTHLTLEHLLYALAHDQDGERILAACGADLPQLRRDLDKYLKESVEQFGRGQQKEPEQTLAFRRVLQTAVLHVQSAGRQEVQSGDVLAATLQQNKSYAAQLLADQGITRLDVLEYITHGISKVPSSRRQLRTPTPTATTPKRARANAAPATARDPLAAYAMNLTDRARAGELDPLIGRTDELQRTIEILCRRRKNNPVFVGDAGVGKTALAEGLATRLLERRRARICSKARRSSRSIPARCSPARGSAATSRSGSRRSSTRSRSGRCRSSSSTRSTRPSAPARRPAARWISRR